MTKISSGGGQRRLMTVASSEHPAASAAMAAATAASSRCGRFGPWLSPSMLATRNDVGMRASSVRAHCATITLL